MKKKAEPILAPTRDETLAMLFVIGTNEEARTMGFERAMAVFMKGKTAKHATDLEEGESPEIIGSECARCVYEKYMEIAGRALPDLWRILGH